MFVTNSLNQGAVFISPNGDTRQRKTDNSDDSNT